MIGLKLTKWLLSICKKWSSFAAGIFLVGLALLVLWRAIGPSISLFLYAFWVLLGLGILTLLGVLAGIISAADQGQTTSVSLPNLSKTDSELYLKDWEMTKDRIKHFDDVVIRIRTQGVPLATAILAAGFVA